MFSSEPRKKKTLTFHYTGCLIGIRIMVYFNPHITGEYVIPYIPGKTTRGPFFIAQVVGRESWLMVNPNLSPSSTAYPTPCTPPEMLCPKILLTNKKHRVNPMDLYLPKYWGENMESRSQVPKIIQNYLQNLSKIIWVITCFHHPNWMKLLIYPSLNAHKNTKALKQSSPRFPNESVVILPGNCWISSTKSKRLVISSNSSWCSKRSDKQT